MASFFLRSGSGSGSGHTSTSSHHGIGRDIITEVVLPDCEGELWAEWDNVVEDD